jgi:hypothetical protein
MATMRLGERGRGRVTAKVNRRRQEGRAFSSEGSHVPGEAASSVAVVLLAQCRYGCLVRVLGLHRASFRHARSVMGSLIGRRDKRNWPGPRTKRRAVEPKEGTTNHPLPGRPPIYRPDFPDGSPNVALRYSTVQYIQYDGFYSGSNR